MSTTTQRPDPAVAAGHPAEGPSPRPARPTSDRFRGDIQGLRAVAVLAVALDHADIGPFSGGFVGVDVFFVISGFLITQLLLAEWQRTGSVSLVRFYSRRARRILPAATLVLVATVLAGTVMLNFIRAKELVVDSVWATFFAANIRFGQQGTDYFAADDPPSALQHYWSLAVEEQFYLVWPLLLGLLLGAFAVVRRGSAASDRTSRRRAQVRLALGLGAVIAVSLVWCLSQTETNPTAAYFSTLARVWELGAGAACAVLLPLLRRLPMPVLAVMTWAGLGMVGWAVVAYSSSTPFPGSAALVPVLGAALVIAGGCAARPAAVRMLLENRPMRTIGDWSYSFYLWHWPFLLLPAAYVGHELDAWQRSGLLLAALVASYLSYTWVENPMRRTVRLSRRPVRTLLLYPVAVAVTLAACFAADQEIDAEVAAAADAPPITVQHFGADPDTADFSPDPAVALVEASVRAAQNSLPVPGDVTQMLESLRNDKADVGGCDYETDVRELCERGAVGADKTLVLFGDSHARHWIPTLDILARKHGYSAYYLVKPGCNPTDVTALTATGARHVCGSWRTWAKEQIAEIQPDVLVMSGEVPDTVLDAAGNEVDDSAGRSTTYRDGLVAMIGQLGPAVGDVVVIGDVPGIGDHPVDCLAQRGNDLGDCLWPRTRDSRLQVRAARDAAEATGSRFVDPSGWFCDDGYCPSVIGDVVPYRDEGHVSTEYAVRLARPLDAQLGLVPQSAR
jgi:peptidoglycan/LPS O-acetylase OafA/YrhL